MENEIVKIPNWHTMYRNNSRRSLEELVQVGHYFVINDGFIMIVNCI